MLETSRLLNIPADHPAIAESKIGVLLINLGTPDATSYWPMRRYLKEFLSDCRVVEANRFLWWFILNAIVLSKRPQKSGAAYDKIWNRDKDESPLRTITRNQANKLIEELQHKDKLTVDWAMRYGTPSIGEKLAKLMNDGCQRIVLFPLYPQYSAATTATAMDKVFEALRAMRWQPAIRSIPPYFDHPQYIDALANSLRQHQDELDWKPDNIVVSFHGLPEEFFHKGDPYFCHCQKTVRLLRQRLQMDETQMLLCFQSRSGRKEWLKPYTEETIVQLAHEGIKNLLVITPGFAADCLETLEEIAIRARQTFLTNGGENFSLIPCLNDTPQSISMLSAITRQQIAGWD